LNKKISPGQTEAIKVICKRTTIVIIFSLVAILFFGNVVPGLAAGVSRGSTPPEYRWQHNPFIPLLTPEIADVRTRKGGQAAPYENFSLPPDLKLKAVIKSDGSYKAIVGNQLVVPDDRVMGFVVVEVQADRVVLLKDGRVLELPLRSMVNKKDSFTISRANDGVAADVHESGQSAVYVEGQKSLIHLVNIVGKPEVSPIE